MGTVKKNHPDAEAVDEKQAVKEIVGTDYRDEVLDRFSFRPARDEHTRLSHERVRSAARDFANQILMLTERSREQSLALTAIEEAMHWANASVAITNEKRLAGEDA